MSDSKTEDLFQDLDQQNRENWDEYLQNIQREAYRYCEEVTITEINGPCPYGHQAGEVFKVTNMNADSMCGSLYQAIHANLVSLHYGGGLPWEQAPDTFRGVCPEGRVQVGVKRVELPKPTVLRTENRLVDMTGKGFTGIDTYRIHLEVLGVANKCTWGHGDGQKVELDIFNIGKVCGFLYWEIYQYLNLLLAGGSAPWEAEPDILHGCCPDPYNQVAFRLIREKR
ncbi:TIGR04076 family protein [Thermodesulfobacteriota bacterium]